MNALSALPIRDLRPRLSVVPVAKGLRSPRRQRGAAIIGATIHYNGPALAFLPNPARELEFVVGVDTPYHQRNLGADSLQYHFVVLSDGQIWQTRSLEYPAWHCGNAEGNERSLAIHLPLGVGQHPTVPQWDATERLMDALGSTYQFSRDACVGHNEWPRTSGAARPSATYRVTPPQSICPGPLVHARLAAYRASSPRPAAHEMWRVLWHAPIRQAPRVTYPDGKDVGIAGWVTPGQEIEVDLLKRDGDAQEIKGVREWLHLANGLGFVWRPNCTKVR